MLTTIFCQLGLACFNLFDGDTDIAWTLTVQGTKIKCSLKHENIENVIVQEGFFFNLNSLIIIRHYILFYIDNIFSKGF